MALNTPYKRINPNEFNYAAVGQKDPWFALGYALGEGYWNRYNQRGTEKSKATIMEGYDNWRKYGDVNGPAPKDLVDQALTISVGGNKATSRDVEEASSGATDKTIKPEVDHGLMKWDYVQNKYANSPNPVSDSISAQKLFSGTEIALNNTNMGAFDEEAFKLAVMDRLTKEGRTPQQREAAWAAIQPMIANKKAEYNNKVSDELYRLYQQAKGIGDNASADRFLMEIQKVNPNMAKVLMDGRITERDRYKAETDKEIARIKATGKGNSSGDVFNSPRMKFIVSERDKLQKKMDEGIDLNPFEQSQYNAYSDEINIALYGNESQDGNKSSSVDYNNPDRWIDEGKAGIQAGKITSDEIKKKAKKALDEKLIDEKTYAKIVEAFPALKARKANDENEAYMFMGRDAREQSGIAKAAKTASLMDWLQENAVHPKK